MEYVKLGRTGLDVSRICLGCMSYGGSNRGNHAWSLDEEASRPFIKRALEVRHQFLRHREPLFARQQRGDPRPGDQGFRPPRRGRDRHQGLWPDAARPERRRPVAQGDHGEIDASLQRLGTDYVDLYQIHRWDYDTPIEETLEALHDVVKAGKARYIGASSMHAWQFARALGIAERHGWTRFVSMQNLVNLLYREEEREMLPLCAAEGIGGHSMEPAGARPADPRLGLHQHPHRDRRGIRAAIRKDRTMPTGKSSIASRRSQRRAAFLARRWRSPGCWPSRSSPRRSSAPPSSHHLDDALASVNVKLSADEITALEEPYVPHAVVGFV